MQSLGLLRSIIKTRSGKVEVGAIIVVVGSSSSNSSSSSSSSNNNNANFWC